MSAENQEGSRTAERIARTIWKNPMISRGEIANRLRLERSTITLQVNRLLDLGLVSELCEGHAGPNGGRRPIHLGINRDYGYVVGIESRSDSFAAVAMNMAGEVLNYRREDRPLCETSFLDDVAAVASSFSGKTGTEAGLRGIGLGVCKETAADTASAVADRFGLHLTIASGAQCGAWGELAFRKSEGPSNFLFALVHLRDRGMTFGSRPTTNLDLGIVIDGKVHTGSDLSTLRPRGAFRSQAALVRHLALFADAFVFETVYVGGDVSRLGAGFLETLEKELSKERKLPERNRSGFTPRTAVPATLADKAVAYGAAVMSIYRVFSRIDA